MSLDSAQRVVLLYDADGNPIVFGQNTMANSLPVVIASNQTGVPVTDNGGSLTVDATALPLPTGAATETTLASINTKTLAAGQATMAASSPVVIASNQSGVPVTDNGGSLTIDAVSLPLPTGAATETTLSALNTNAADIETILTAIRDTAGIKKITDPLPAGSNNIGDVDVVSSALPTGAATETTLSSINTKTLAAGQATMAASSPVVIASNQSTIPVSNAAASQVDGHSASIGATTDADTANTLIGRIKQLLTRLPAALVGGRLDTNIGAWFGSTAPTVGQKTMTASLPVVLPSDQLVNVAGTASEEATFTATATAVVLGNGKSLLSVYNPTGSTVILKLREYYVRNSQTTAVTGVAAQLEIHRFTTGTTPTGGTAITVALHDTNDALGAGVDTRTGGTIAGEVAQALDVMRISSDDWGPGTLDQEGAQQTISNYLPARVKRDPQQKAVCVMRAGGGVHLKCVTNTTAGSFDLIFVFTQV